MFHRLHSAISKKIRQVLYIRGGGLVVVGDGGVVFEEEPEGLCGFMLLDMSPSLKVRREGRGGERKMRRNKHLSKRRIRQDPLIRSHTGGQSAFDHNRR